MSDTRLRWLFMLNATILCTHQIDAAYWHEWNLFQLPGGNQLNLILNLPLVLSVFVAFSFVVMGSVHARRAHLYLVFLGFLTVTLHGLFFSWGHTEFQQPMSLVLIAATGFLSAVQFLSVRQAHARAAG